MAFYGKRSEMQGFQTFSTWQLLNPFPTKDVYIRPTCCHATTKDVYIHPQTKYSTESLVVCDALNKSSMVVEKGLALILKDR